MVEYQEEIVNLIVLEIAKGKTAAVTEVTRTIDYIEYTFEEMKRMHPRTYTGDS